MNEDTMYLVKDGKLTRTFRWDDVPEELYLIQENGSLLLYQEHLDGWLICEDEARNLYPEEFI